VLERLPLYATITGSLLIAGSLLAVSFGHIRAFAESAGAAPWEATVIAITVDALVLLALGAVGQARRVGQAPPAMAKIALVVGIVATTGANLHYGWSHGWMGIVVSLWVPVAAELAYQLAMAAIRMGAGGQQERPVICGHHISVATVMARAHARPVICGQDVPVAMLAATLVAVRRPAPRDPRPVICGRVVAVATLVATMPPRRRPVVAICGGHLIPVEAVTRPLVDLRPAICGHVVAISDVTIPERPADLRRVICSPVIPVADVAMPRALADLRPQICTAPVTVAEVMARTAVATPAPVATATEDRPAPRPRPANRPVATVAAREAAILDWIAEAEDPDKRMANASGDDVVQLLAAAGHRVSDRTARRDLQAVRDQLATVAA
jgi:hypothetical protein